MFKLKIFLCSVILICILTGTQHTFAGELIWETTVKSAFFKAMSEKKKILLFVGRNTCGKCRYMRTQVFETEKPGIKSLLEKKFILWFSDADKSTEWYPVARGLGEIPLPLICIIDPYSGKNYEDRTTGIQHSPDFYSRLMKHTK